MIWLLVFLLMPLVVLGMAIGGRRDRDVVPAKLAYAVTKR